MPEISDELPDLGRLIAVVTLKSSKIARVVRDRRRIVPTGDSMSPVTPMQPDRPGYSLIDPDGAAQIGAAL